MDIQTFKNKLKTTPRTIVFSETMDVIETNYEFTPKAFKNGPLENAEGQNSGSCKLFAFAITEGLSKEETLACFGAFYFKDVLKDPNGEGHQNIRNFMNTSFEGLVFESFPLVKK
ncbi:HopJ type III effector protein [Oceanihabitans sp. 2_MG-2023]|uniref:HopJ type III effector protein n=1 Tax=Oceanihabitans sp. 2_MG-2023 TaxID=3062661 RepID=UPI0026E31DF6|nr:HopJ type III effector protein [Oceanihabitans sp. 2_MG-2023]MDO6595783.1 HopJ type III effector protein [Oceanihabitans sp. 2_MG-2023]